MDIKERLLFCRLNRKMMKSLIVKLSILFAVCQYFTAGEILDDSFLRIDSQSSILIDDHLTISILTAVSDKSYPLIIWLYMESSLSNEVFLGKMEFSIANANVNETVIAVFKISHRLSHFDSRRLENPTDFFAKNLKAKACIFDPLTKLCHEQLTEEAIFPLVSPWRRKELHTFTASWSLQAKILSQQRKVPQCHGDVADTVILASSQMAVSGKKDQGFMRKLPAINWPKHVPKRVIKSFLSQPRFTLEMKIFLLEPCPHDFCEIMTHRLFLKFLSPVILLNKQGLLHIQFHDVNEAGEAFVTHFPLPIKEWIHLVITVEGNQTQLSISKVNGEENYQKYVHRFRDVAFDSEEGIWNIGGYYGFHGFRGLICCVRLHRRKSMQPEELSGKDVDILKQHDILGLVKRCGLIRGIYRSILKKRSNSMAVCPYTSFQQHFSKHNQTRLTRKKRLSKYLKESLKVLDDFMKTLRPENLHKKDDLARELYFLGLNKIAHSANTAIRLLELSGCLGSLQSFLATSLIQYFNEDAPFSSKLITSWQLYSAMHDDDLSQLALSYKHQLGCNGLQKDVNVAAGYAKAAALSAKKIMEDEEQFIHTQSEMIRLDEAHLFTGKRGVSSDVIKWLRHQAEWGSMSAQTQMAEILYYGQHGVNAQRNEAVNLYRAGAMQGDAHSMYNLGVLHLRGIEVEKNETIALDLFKKAAKKNLTIAFNSLGYHELVNRHNISGALHFWKIASDLGDKDAMTNLGLQYENGVPGVLDIDKKKAVNFFKRSAEKGQKDGCIRYADHLVTGVVVEQNEYAAIRYYRYVAEQLPTIGLYLRNAFDSYGEGNWNTSLLMYMLVSETGLALGSFNVALLCDEMLQYKMNVGLLGTNCSLHFYNLSSILGWPESIIRMGDEYWYGKRVAVNRTKANANYAWVASTHESPQAFFNLGFIIENNYSVDGITFDDKKTNKRGNLSLAKIFYERCRNSKQDNGDGYYPCTIALMNLKVKLLIRDQKLSLIIGGLVFIAMLVIAFISSDEIY